MQEKIVTTNKLIKILEKQRKHKTVGIITGCFDVLHKGRIEIFRFAKETVSVLVVGIDADAAIKKSKGNTKPINNQKDRATVLSAIAYIDYVLLMKGVYKFSSSGARRYHKKLLMKLKPDYLITSSYADELWRLKRKLIKEVGGTLLLDTRKKVRNSTILTNRLIGSNQRSN